MIWPKLQKLTNAWIKSVTLIGSLLGIYAFFGVFGAGIGDLLSFERLGAWNLVQLFLGVTLTLAAVAVNIVAGFMIKRSESK